MGYEISNAMKKTMLVVSGILLAIGNCGGPLVLRLYFIHGGSRLWLSTCLTTIGFPIVILPLAIAYYFRRKNQGPNTKFFIIKFPAFTSAAVLGLVLGLDNYLYAYGIQRLPVSTVALIIASQLAFNAVSAFFIVKQKFTAYTINAIVLLTVGAAVLAMHAGSDRPAGESSKSYVIGFAMTVAGAALGGLLFPLIELALKKSKQTVTYTLAMEFQMIMCITATVFSMVGMAINKDFKAISREAKAYGLGEARYYVVLVANAIVWQFNSWGSVGVIFCASALVSGILISVLLPISEVLAVIFYHDAFKAEKGVALALCLWGFISHFYGEFKHSKKRNNQIQQTDTATPMEMTPNIAP